ANDQWIDDAAEIIDDRVVRDARDTGRQVDLDFADMATVRIVEILALVARGLVEARALARRPSRSIERRLDDVEERNIPVGTRDPVFSRPVVDVVLVCFEQMRSNPLALLDDHSRGEQDGGAAEVK